LPKKKEMKHFTLLCFLFLMQISANAQTLVAERFSDLMPEGYVIQGDGVLREYDDGTLTFTLTSDFSTPYGPDVRILLGNSLSTNNSIELVNLTTINHFNGELVLDVPSDVDIEEFQFVLFFCVQFNQFWASGQFGDTTFPGGGIMCTENQVMGDNGELVVDVCPTNGQPSVVSFFNSLNISAGDNYAYLITDNSEILQEVVFANSYDFEGSSTDIQRVYGIHYDGDLNIQIGMNRMETTASACHVHSDSDYLTVTKNGCNQGFECEDNLTATTDWATEAGICATDGEDDWVELRNSLFIDPGEHYAFLITDANEIVQEVVFEGIYNFEGTGIEEQRVYGVHFDGDLIPQLGESRFETTATGCFMHSGGNLFLTIQKTATCLVATVEASVAAQVKTFPNPTTGVLNIETPESFQPTKIIISNILGQEVINNIVTPADNIQVDLNNLPVGGYLVRMENEEEFLTRRISVNR